MKCSFQIVAIFICSNFVLGAEKHIPEVHENTEETLSEVSRKARHYGDKYKPPVFIYGKTIQPDLRKWRYFQQQQVDSKNMEKIFKHLEAANLFYNIGIQHRDRPEPISKEQEVSTPVVLEPRWKIVHPKLVTEKRNDFSPDELIKMQEQYGRKHIRKLAVPENVTTEEYNVSSNALKKPTKRDYRVEEPDLEADASEITENQSSSYNQHQSAIILSSGLPSNSPAMYVGARVPEPTTKTLPSSHKPLDQTDLDALYSILGKTKTAQIHGLKQLLHSQAVEVAAVPVSNLQNTQIPVADIQPAQIQIQVGDQSLEQIQAQLDVLSRKQGEQAIAEAHQKALEYVRSQQNAIEEAYAQRALSIATIKPHSLQQSEALAQNALLTQSEHPVQNVVLNNQYTVLLPQDETSHTTSHNLNSVQNIHPQSYISSNNDATKHLQLQAQAYLQLASQNYATPNQQASHSTSENQNQYTSIHPEIINNGVSGINTNHPLDSNIEHAQQQAVAYEKSASQAYLQPTEAVQNVYVNSENTNLEEQSTDQHGHEVSSYVNYEYLTSKSSLLNTSVDKKVRIKRQSNNDTDYFEYDYNDTNAEEEIITDTGNISESTELLPKPEKFMSFDHGFYDDSSDIDSSYNYETSDSKLIPAVSPFNRRYSRFKYSSKYHRPHKYTYINKPDVSFSDDSLSTIEKVLPTKHNGNPTVILINNNNGNTNHDSKPHKRKHRIKKRPIYRKRNYSKIDRKIRKALINVHKFVSGLHKEI